MTERAVSALVCASTSVAAAIATAIRPSRTHVVLQRDSKLRISLNPFAMNISLKGVTDKDTFFIEKIRFFDWCETMTKGVENKDRAV